MSTAEIDYDQLDRRFRDIEQKLLEAGEKYGELRDAKERGDTWARDFRDATLIHRSYDAEYESLRNVLQNRPQPEPGPEATGPSAAFAVAGPESRTAGAEFVDSAAYRDRRGINTETHEVRNLLTGYTNIDTTGSNLWLPVGQPWANPPVAYQDQAAIRSLVSVQGTTLAAIPYIRETSPLANQGGASAVAEASAKPEVSMLFEGDTAIVRKIAAWIRVSDEAVADAPTLRGYIDTRLAYMLVVRENAQILNGNGTAPNVKGILQFSGVQTQSATSGDIPATLADSLSKIEVVGGVPDGILMHPSDYWNMLSTRHATFLDAGLGGNLPYGDPGQQVWGVRVVRSVAQTAGHATVGAWRMGATLFDRQQTTIQVTNSHGELFVSNILVVLAEERIAVACWRPDFFVDATL